MKMALAASGLTESEAIRMKEKSQVADIDRSVYDIRDKEDDAYRMQEGLTPEIIDKLSKEKDDPDWIWTTLRPMFAPSPT